MDKIQKSLARIEGQVRGVAKMYALKKPCLEIAQQLTAAREAFSRIGREILTAEACQMMTKPAEKHKLEKVLERLFKS